MNTNTVRSAIEMNSVFTRVNLAHDENNYMIKKDIECSFYSFKDFQAMRKKITLLKKN